ncbi:MAG: ribonuclease HII [Pseudomonadota bacterium]
MLQLPAPNEPLVIGVDEAGRGPLAGPVSVAAVVLDPGCIPAGVADSKALKAARRESLAEQIRATALHWSVVLVDVETIDRINILEATLQGMQRAVAQLNCQIERVLIDGNRAPDLVQQHVETWVNGDARHASMAAASILAKVHRDQQMLTYDQQWPQFGFAQHKGYGTAAHKAALEAHGPCPIHRRSFAPVRRLLAAQH